MVDCVQLHHLSSSDEPLHYKGKNFIWVTDTATNYTGLSQLQYNTNTLTNGWLDHSESFLSIPYTWTLTNATGAAGVCAGALGPKSGSWQIHESSIISLNNVGITSQQNNSNLVQSMRAALEFSSEKVKQDGALLFYSPDTPETNAFTTGTGPVNNIITTSLPSHMTGAFSSIAPQYNSGLYQRVQWTGMTPSSAPTSSQSNFVNTYRPFTKLTGTTQTYYGFYYLPLKYISKLFSALGLQKNLSLNLLFNINQGNVVVNTSNQVVSTTCPNSNGTFPINITDIGVTSAFGTITVSQAIGAYNGNTVFTRLYMPVIQMDPLVEKYISPLYGKKRTIKFWDYNTFKRSNVSANTADQWLVSSCLKNPKRITFVPIVASVACGNNFSPFMNPCSSEPATTSPNMDLSSVMLQLNGVSFFPNNPLYDYEWFQQIVMPEKCNAAQDAVITSGISYQDWLWSYKYYTFNVSRMGNLVIDPSVPISCVFNYTNNSAVACDLYCIVEWENAIAITTFDQKTEVCL